MNRARRPGRPLLWLVAFTLAPLAAIGAPDQPPAWMMCAPCHGVDGGGDGPAVDLLWPRPRDLRRDPLKLGADRASLRRTIRRGIPGTAMPAFPDLPQVDLDALVQRLLSARSPASDPPPLALPAPQPDALERGRRLWTAQGCAACHGESGAGDGPLADTLRDADGTPSDLYDLRRSPLKGGAALADIFRSLTRGRPGTPMTARDDLPPDDRRALAALIISRRSPTPGDAPWRLPPPGVAPRARDDWWGQRPLPDPGPPPPGTPPALIAADPSRCGLCHPRQHATWSQSRHARAAGPGLLGQYHGADPTFIGRCNACHAPTARQQRAPEQRPPRALRQGVTCAGCHLRDHQKHGPPRPGRPADPRPIAATPNPRFLRSDFCLPCHNLPLDAAVAGRPLLDTWREWAGSPYLPAGVQCQDCHQPDGAHAVPGAHDPEMVRRAVRLDVDPPTIDSGRIRLQATVHNVGAGHHFPTTATPRAVLRIRQLGDDGPLPGTAETWAISRTVRHDGSRWLEEADTRIPAGEARARRYDHPRHPAARRIEVSLHLFPDWFYARFYRARLKRDLDPAARADFEAALAEAEASVILIDFRRLPLPEPTAP